MYLCDVSTDSERDYNNNGEGDARGDATPKHLTRRLTATRKDAVTADSEPDEEESGRRQTADKAEWNGGERPLSPIMGDAERERSRGSPARKAGIAGICAPLTNWCGRRILSPRPRQAIRRHPPQAARADDQPTPLRTRPACRVDGHHDVT